MEAQAPLRQEEEEEEEEYNLKAEVEEGEVGLLIRQSTTRRYGVSTTSNSTSNNGTNAHKGPEAEQEWVEDRALLAPAARTELDTDNGVEGKESTWTNIVHFDGERGTESIQRIVKTGCSDIEQVSYETETVHETSDVATQRFSAFLSSLVDLQDRGISGDDRFLDSALLSPRKSSDEKNTYSKEGKVVAEVDLIEELNPEETGFDVEEVLEKQNTHDLYCPNCRSCITRRVILRRKLPKLPNVHDRPGDKFEGTTAPEEEDRSRAGLNGHHNDDGERGAFRCLSCFSIFFPPGDRFTLFPLIGGRPKPPKVQDPPEAPGAKSSTLFPSAPGVGKTVTQPGTVQPTPPIYTDVPGEVPAKTRTQTPAKKPQVAQVRQSREWDIVKSIVYGGLMESVASLGVVSSAAGAGASTLSTLGLGLANLFGGLLAIVHNLRVLRVLKNEQASQGTEQASQGTEQVDRYQEVLGNRQHFPLHATVAILSFILFGCVAPITYAFSFRESDNRDYKLAAVAGASLFCILLLALGKAHVREPPKDYLKTVLYYVIMGFGASGVSFLVGELIDELLTKLGWFDSTSSLSGTGPLQTGTRQSGWATY